MADFKKFADAVSTMRGQTPQAPAEAIIQQYDPMMSSMPVDVQEQERQQFFQQNRAMNPALQTEVQDASFMGTPVYQGMTAEESAQKYASEVRDIDQATQALEGLNKLSELGAEEAAAEEARARARFQQDMEKVMKYNEQAAKAGVPLKDLPTASAYGIKDAPATPQDIQAAQQPTVKEVEEARAPIRKQYAADLAVQREMQAREVARAQEQAEVEQKAKEIEQQVETDLYGRIAKGQDSWTDRLRFGLAVGLAAGGKGTNVVMDMYNKRVEQIENDKKLSQEQKLAAQKLDLDKAELELKKASALTENQYKKAQIEKLRLEIDTERVKKQGQLQFLLRAKSGQGISDEDFQFLNENQQKSLVRLPNGKYALAFNEKAADRVNKYESEIQPAIAGAKRVLDIANDPNFSRLSLEDRARVAVEIKALVGQLRLPFTGPGQLTEKEYDRLLSTVGDPSALASFPYLERAKLETLVNKLSSDLKGQYKSAGIDLPMTREEKEMELLRRRNPGVPDSVLKQSIKRGQ